MKKGRKVEVKSQTLKKAFDKKPPKEPTKAALKKAKDAFGFDSDSVKSEESVTVTAASAAAVAPKEEPKESEPLSLADRLKKSNFFLFIRDERDIFTPYPCELKEASLSLKGLECPKLFSWSFVTLYVWPRFAFS